MKTLLEKVEELGSRNSVREVLLAKDVKGFCAFSLVEDESISTLLFEKSLDNTVRCQGLQWQLRFGSSRRSHGIIDLKSKTHGPALIARLIHNVSHITCQEAMTKTLKDCMCVRTRLTCF